MQATLEVRSVVPQVKCARWQAKQARLAFFLRGLDGSFGLGFWPFAEAPFAVPSPLASVFGLSGCSPAALISWLASVRSAEGAGESCSFTSAFISADNQL